MAADLESGLSRSDDARRRRSGRAFVVGTASPVWFPCEFDWVVGCTYAGMDVRGGRIRNPIGANMSIRADVIARAGGPRWMAAADAARPQAGLFPDL
jgi:hypothetical protein